MPRKRVCKGKTKAGKRCRATPRRDTGYCNAHSPRETQEKSGFGGAQPGAGRPRLPSPHELMRERIEADLERWLKPYEDALEAERAVVVGSGETADVEYVPDHRSRMQAAREALDRVYGKPKQAVELGGSETPVGAEIVVVSDRERSDAAREYLRRIAGE